MHNDEILWRIIGNNFCSYKAKILTETFCRHSHNVTGLCNKVSCPLSNGYYATVIEENGICYLCLKTIERCHLPRSMWEKIELSSNYQKALAEIDSKMKNIYKDHEIHRCKQRLTRLRQTLLRMRQMQLQPETQRLPVKKKTERREATREAKAKTAAKLEISIEQELLNRLKQGIYGDIYNCDREAFEQTLREKELLEANALEEEEKGHPSMEEDFCDQEDTYFVEDEESESDMSKDNTHDFSHECQVAEKDVEELDEVLQSQYLHSKRNSIHLKKMPTSRPKKTQFERGRSKVPFPRVEIEYEHQAEDCEMEH